MLIQTLYFLLFFFLLNFILKVCSNWNKIHVFFQISRILSVHVFNQLERSHTNISLQVVAGNGGKHKACRIQTCTQVNNKQSGNQDVDVCRHGKVKLWASCEHSDFSRRDETGHSCPGLRSKIMWVNNRHKFIFRKLSVQFWILG